MQKFSFKVFLFFYTILSIHAYSQQKISPKHPKLIIQVVVEQMRYDLIHRYWEKFSDKGFKKLIDQGAFCSNAFYDYMVTESAPGFATIATGANPSEHGIVSNNWYVRLSEKEQFCISDGKNTNSNLSDNNFSPKQIIGTTYSDELRMSNYKQSKAIGISLKNYAAILSSGTLANAAYWFDDKNGNWTSSPYYMDSVPLWVKQFNQKEFVQQYLKREWNTIAPVHTYKESLSDNNSYETGFSNKQKTFPYDLSKLSNLDGPQIIKYTPFGNTYTLDFSIAAIMNENLGKDQYPDFISISFSTPGYVNERFGLHSVELEDIYLRLDNDIAHLLEFIDDYLGRENVLVVLTSDRGASENPAFSKEIGIPVGKFNPDLAISLTESYLKATYGQSGWIKHYSNGQIYLNQYFLDISKVPVADVQIKIAQFISQFKGVASTTTGSILQSADSTSGILQKFRNSYNQIRSGDVFICLLPGWIEDRNSMGHDFVNQSSPYRYDSHVPLIFYGWKIAKTEISDPIPMNNLAPTIVKFLDISYPTGANGKAIGGILVK